MKVSAGIIILIAKLVVSNKTLPPTEYKVDQTLRFGPDKRFKILQLTDLHLSNFSNDQDSIDLARVLIRETRPNLVVFTGDLVNDYSWTGEKGYFQAVWQKFADLCDSEKVLYTIAWGNHDMGSDLTLDQIAQLQTTSVYNIFPGNMAEDPRSLSNFYLKIFSSEKPEEVVSLLWILDTRNKGCLFDNKDEGCIDGPLIEFYE